MGDKASSEYNPMSDRAAKPVKFGTKLALIAGFGGVLGLMVVAGINSIQVLHYIEVGNRQITQSYLVRHHTLDRIRTTVYLSGTMVRDYLLDPNPKDARAHLAHLKKLHQEMESALKSYSAAQMPEEAPLVRELTAELYQYWNDLSPTFHWTAEERQVRGYAFLESKVYSQRTALLDIADKIDAVNGNALRAGDRRSAALFQSFRRRIVTMLIITLGLGIGLAALIVIHILGLEQDARLRYQEILRARGELQRLSIRLVEAQEEERRSISRELHDEVGQSLSALLVDLGNLAATIPQQNGETHRLLVTVKRVAEGSLNAVRNMALLLRPSMLDDFGLIPALRWQAREVSRRTGLHVHLVAEDVADELPEEYKTCVYRLVQEALHNCSRHADAKNVHVVVKQKPDRLLLTVKDDGKGFDTKQTRGLGLIGMEERVRHLGGRFEVSSQPGHGTRLAIDLPLIFREAQVAEVSL
jgi:signal transduction histidine kinase